RYGRGHGRSRDQDGPGRLAHGRPEQRRHARVRGQHRLRQREPRRSRRPQGRGHGPDGRGSGRHRGQPRRQGGVGHESRGGAADSDSTRSGAVYTGSCLAPVVWRPLATLESKAFPIRVRFTPDGSQALVANARSGDVAVFDTKTRREVRRLRSDLKPKPGGQALLTFGESAVPVGIVVSPDGARAFVAHTSADAIAAFSLPGGKPAGILSAGREPDGMAYSPALV